MKTSKPAKTAKTKKVQQPKQKHGPLFYIGIAVALVFGAALELAIVWFFGSVYKPTFSMPVHNGLTTTIEIIDCGDRSAVVIPAGQTASVKGLATYESNQGCSVIDHTTHEFLGCVVMPMGLNDQPATSLTIDSKTLIRLSRISCALTTRNHTGASAD